MCGLITNTDVHVIELTICHETNMTNSKNYKTNKYRDLDQFKTSLTCSWKNYHVSYY